VSWVYRFDERALKELRKLGHQAQQDILAYLDKRVDGTGDPRKYGKGLKANLSGLWRYRVGVVAISCRGCGDIVSEIIESLPGFAMAS